MGAYSRGKKKDRERLRERKEEKKKEKNSVNFPTAELEWLEIENRIDTFTELKNSCLKIMHSPIDISSSN